MGTVLYVTGAPATGKTTLCKYLTGILPGLHHISYSDLLRQHLLRSNGRPVESVDIRQDPARHVMPEDIEATDAALIAEVTKRRGLSHVIVDSHPVSKESFGFRVTQFSQNNLKQLAPDIVICLYAQPRVLADRIKTNADGRPLPTESDLTLHVALQVSIASQYGFFLGKPCYILDSSVTIGALGNTVRKLIDVRS